MQLTISNKFALRYKYLLEAMDVPPPINFKVPPAYVQSVDTYAGHYRSDEMRKLEAVVACLVLEAGGEGIIGMEWEQVLLLNLKLVALLNQEI